MGFPIQDTIGGALIVFIGCLITMKNLKLAIFLFILICVVLILL